MIGLPSVYTVPLVIILLAIFVAFSFVRKLPSPHQKPITKKKPRLLIRGYDIFYTDKKTGKKKNGIYYSVLLVAKELDIAGKPDYILKKKSGSDLIPVELKSGTIGRRKSPRNGDLMQLCCYFAIIESHFGIKPKYGHLVYSDYMFVIKNTKYLRGKLVKTLNDMRGMIGTGNYKSSPSLKLCKHCLCRGTVCKLYENNCK